MDWAGLKHCDASRGEKVLEADDLRFGHVLQESGSYFSTVYKVCDGLEIGVSPHNIGVVMTGLLYGEKILG